MPATHERPRTRLLRWTLTAFALLLVALWIVSASEPVGYAGADWMISAHRGGLRYSNPHEGPIAGPWTPSVPWVWWFAVSDSWTFYTPYGTTSGGLSVVVPLWAPTLAAFLPAALLWRQRRRLRPPGHCPACGYDRKGLDAAAACPECGKGDRPGA